MVTVKLSILYPLENEMNRHQIMSLNTRRNVSIHYFVLANLFQKRNRSRYQKKRQCAYTFFLVHLPYYTNKAIIINVFYHPWHQHCIIWVMNMRQNISSGVSKILIWKFRIKVECTFSVKWFWGIKENNEQRLNYHIEEWYTSTPYYIYWNKYNYPTVCLWLDTWQRTNHCITVCGKWIFDFNFEVNFHLHSID